MELYIDFKISVLDSHHMKEGSKRGFWDGLSLEFLIAGYNYENPKLSPDGKFVSYTMSNENGTHLYLFDISTSQHFQIGRASCRERV